ncbi:hypothetical protein [Amycolatopsis alkalitolerans]|uniref:Uncharacterized protein n=1 Tax=Amycolatopsis alkalitolerans TaxID=2547244 RepID=A0A5C4LPV9_9PSEU|nr:hypothetical protein [Amycolatopsis alkalitolerans]TNC20077.1 hypothetical protein FG385_31620 [Amycolatopsis alkalitolerans]
MVDLGPYVRGLEEARDLLTAAIEDLRYDEDFILGRETTTPEEDGRPDVVCWTPSRQPPAGVWVFWCPACGRLFPSCELPGRVHYRDLGDGSRRRCDVTPVELRYRLHDTVTHTEHATNDEPEQQT